MGEREKGYPQTEHPGEEQNNPEREAIDRQEIEYIEAHESDSFQVLFQEFIEKVLHNQNRVLQELEEGIKTEDGPRVRILRARLAQTESMIQHYAEMQNRITELSNAAFDAILSKNSERYSEHHNPELLKDAIDRVGGPAELARHIGLIFEFYDVKEHVMDDFDEQDRGYHGVRARQLKVLRQNGRSGSEQIRERPEADIRARTDASSFDYDLIATLECIGREHPEARDEIDQALRTILDRLSQEVQAGRGGVFHGDEELYGEEYEGLERSSERQYDNVTRYAIQHAVGTLGRTGNVESISYLREWLKDQSAIFVPTVAHAVQELNPERAAQEFLPGIRSEDRFERRAAQYILQRLEFGRIGMSKRGAQYLDKVYDLGSRNEEGNIVQRVSDRGQLGVFVPDEQGSFQFDGLFDMDWSDERTVQPAVSSLTAETLFVPQRGESADERAEREQIAQEFIQKYMAFSDDRIFKESSTRLNNHSLREQAAFFRYVTRADEATKSRLDTFMKRYESDGLKTFLSLEGGSRHGDRILDLAEILPPDIAAQFIDRYARIVDAVELVMEYSKDMLPEGEELTPDTAEHIRENLLTKAHALVERLHAELPSATGEPASHERILNELDDANAALLLFASTFRELYRGGAEVGIDEFKNTEFEQKPATALGDEEKGEMLEIARRNYASEDLEYILHDISSAFESEDTHFMCRDIKERSSDLCALMRSRMATSMPVH